MNPMEDLKAYVDGELSPARRKEIEAAMDQDERLRRELEEIRVLSRLIGDCVVQPEPVGLDSVLLALESRRRPSFFAALRKNPLQYGWAFALAGFVLLAIFFPSFKQQMEGADANVAMRDLAASSTAESSAKSSAPAATAPAEKMKNGKAESQYASPSEDRTLYRDYERKATGGAGFGVHVEGRSPERMQNGSGLVKSNGVAIEDSDAKAADGVAGELNQRFEVPGRAGATLGYKTQPQSSRAPGQAFLVKSGQFSLQVMDVRNARVQVEGIAKTLRGYVEDSYTAEPQAGQLQASYGLRVPVNSFDNATTEVRKLGKVLSESTNTQNVTSQVVDADARLKAKKIEAQGYEKMMKGAKKVPDMLEIRDRLGSVREEIESLEAERKTLANQATYSTLLLTLSQPEQAKKVVPPPAKPSWYDTAWNSASARASGLGKWLAEVGMNLLVLAPVWVPVVAGLWWLGRRSRRR